MQVTLIVQEYKVSKFVIHFEAEGVSGRASSPCASTWKQARLIGGVLRCYEALLCYKCVGWWTLMCAVASSVDFEAGVGRMRVVFSRWDGWSGVARSCSLKIGYGAVANCLIERGEQRFIE